MHYNTKINLIAWSFVIIAVSIMLVVFYENVFVPVTQVLEYNREIIKTYHPENGRYTYE